MNLSQIIKDTEKEFEEKYITVLKFPDGEAHAFKNWDVDKMKNTLRQDMIDLAKKMWEEVRLERKACNSCDNLEIDGIFQPDDHCYFQYNEAVLEQEQKFNEFIGELK